MQESCCTGLLKFLMFFVNFLVALCGLILIILGAVGLHENHKNVVGGYVDAGAITIIVLGVIIFGISFCGFCGSITANPCLLLFFIIFMTIIVILEIVLGIVVLNHKSDVNHYVRNKALQSFDRYVHDQSSYGSYSNPSTDTLLWDRFQHNFGCCGYDSPLDYQKIQMQPPESCYNCLGYLCQQGCGHEIHKMYDKILPFISISAIVLAVVQITGIIFACYLYFEFR